MIIAKAGNFILTTSTFVIEHVDKTNDICIAKIGHYDDGRPYMWVIANLVCGEVSSCGNRMFEDIEPEEWDNFRDLAKIAVLIGETEYTCRNWEDFAEKETKHGTD